MVKLTFTGGGEARPKLCDAGKMQATQVARPSDGNHGKKKDKSRETVKNRRLEGKRDRGLTIAGVRKHDLLLQFGASLASDVVSGYFGTGLRI
jgi:hypothetical protein